MSDDSSSAKILKLKQPLAGWAAGVYSLLATAGVYIAVPILAASILFTVLSVSGQSLDEIKRLLTNSITAQFFYILLAEVLTVAAVFGLLKLFRWNWKTIGLAKPRWTHPLLGLAAVVPYFVLYILMAQLVSALVPGFDISQTQEIGFGSASGGLELTLTFVSLVILPPLAEEITMRGFLYTGLRKWLPRIVAALLVSILFGAAHLSEGGAAGPLWIGALDTAILSMVLIGLRELTGNLWAGITLHMAKNFIAFLALFIFHVR
jgi:membrane protease YdiL (CAAX protease family)